MHDEWRIITQNPLECSQLGRHAQSRPENEPRDARKVANNVDFSPLSLLSRSIKNEVVYEFTLDVGVTRERIKKNRQTNFRKQPLHNAFAIWRVFPKSTNICQSR